MNRKCEFCGAKISKNDTFCKECGMNFNKKATDAILEDDKNGNSELAKKIGICAIILVVIVLSILLLK